MKQSELRPNGGVVKINAAALKDMREARGLTLSELQTEVSALRDRDQGPKDRPVSLSYLSELESGVKPGSPRIARWLAEALRCSMATLLVPPEREEVA